MKPYFHNCSYSTTTQYTGCHEGHHDPVSLKVKFDNFLEDRLLKMASGPSRRTKKKRHTWMILSPREEELPRSLSLPEIGEEWKHQRQSEQEKPLVKKLNKKLNKKLKSEAKNFRDVTEQLGKALTDCEQDINKSFRKCRKILSSVNQCLVDQVPHHLICTKMKEHQVLVHLVKVLQVLKENVLQPVKLQLRGNNGNKNYDLFIATEKVSELIEILKGNSELQEGTDLTLLDRLKQFVNLLDVNFLNESNTNIVRVLKESNLQLIDKLMKFDENLNFNDPKTKTLWLNFKKGSIFYRIKQETEENTIPWHKEPLSLEKFIYDAKLKKKGQKLHCTRTFSFNKKRISPPILKIYSFCSTFMNKIFPCKNNKELNQVAVKLAYVTAVNATSRKDYKKNVDDKVSDFCETASQKESQLLQRLHKKYKDAIGPNIKITKLIEQIFNEKEKKLNAALQEYLSLMISPKSINNNLDLLLSRLCIGLTRNSTVYPFRGKLEIGASELFVIDPEFEKITVTGIQLRIFRNNGYRIPPTRFPVATITLSIRRSLNTEVVKVWPTKIEFTEDLDLEDRNRIKLILLMPFFSGDIVSSQYNRVYSQ